jgi:hypothetical protein
MTQEYRLQRIEAKLSALLAIATDRFLRETEIAKPRPRSIDRLLADAGLSPKEIAAVLGKTERAVQLVLAQDQSKKRARTGALATTREEETNADPPN